VRIRFEISMLGIEIRNSLNLFWVFFFIFTFRLLRYIRRCRFLMEHIDVGYGIV
jgi:hypothetical protein